MKRVTWGALSRAAATLSAAACTVWCLAGVALAAPAALQRPVAGNGFAISLAASSPYEPIGQLVTLTATANTDVGPTPYYVTIYSETTGAPLGVCGSGTTCTVTVDQGSAEPRPSRHSSVTTSPAAVTPDSCWSPVTRSLWAGGSYFAGPFACPDQRRASGSQRWFQ
jgi:hypothetical protein